MKLRAALFLAVLPATLSQSRAQSPTQPSVSQTPAITSESTLVLVPALVRNKAGELIFGLNAPDFALADDGIPQRLHLEKDTGGEPLALVIDIEGGGSALRELAKFASAAPMIDSIVGNVPHEVAVVAFDSSPALVTGFTSDTDTAADGIRALIDDNSGDGGAAMLDSIRFSLDLLRTQPPQYHRAILLISETNGDTSKLKLAEAVRLISDSNTTIYSVGFSTGKSAAKAIWAQRGSDPPPPADCTGCFSLWPEIRMAAMAGVVAIDGLRRNVPETVANLTGGEYLQFSNEKSLANDLGIISNHIPNRYVLSFQPQSPRSGFHAIKLTAPHHANLEVTARNGYWAEPHPTPTK